MSDKVILIKEKKYPDMNLRIRYYVNERWKINITEDLLNSSKQINISDQKHILNDISFPYPAKQYFYSFAMPCFAIDDIEEYVETLQEIKNLDMILKNIS